MTVLSVTELIKQLSKLKKKEPHALVYVRGGDFHPGVVGAQLNYILGLEPVIILDRRAD